MSSGRPAGSGRRVELHAHTHYSDGHLSPAALVARAIEVGVDTLAITDHDTVEGVPDAIAAAGESVEIIPGIELSSTMDGQDVHILGYFLRHTDGSLHARLQRFREERRDRARAIAQRLAELGAPIDADEVLASAGPGVVGRPHVAQALLRAGHVRGMDEAFQRYLGQHASAYVPRPAFHSEEAIVMIRNARGCAVLAHPGQSVTALMLQRLAGAGLAGVEVWHPVHGTAVQRKWHSEAERLGLIACGGSDFHGPLRGADLGSQPVPRASVDALRALAIA